MRIFKTVLVSAATIFSFVNPAQAAVFTFATYSALPGGANVEWLNSSANGIGTGGSFITTATSTSNTLASRNVSFSFLSSGLVPFVTDVTAAFTLNAGAPIGNIATLASGFLIQGGVNGTFSFKTTAPITIGATTFATGSNLLTGMFASTAIAGQRNGTTASFSGSTAAGDTLVYTSDFLSFANVDDTDFSISLSAVTPKLQAVPTTGKPTSALRTFRAVSGGSFSSDPEPSVTAAVPEPATWAMMLMGFGIVGAAMRRRKQNVTIRFN